LKDKAFYKPEASKAIAYKSCGETNYIVGLDFSPVEKYKSCRWLFIGLTDKAFINQKR
jgi:hypothetical protein